MIKNLRLALRGFIALMLTSGLFILSNSVNAQTTCLSTQTILTSGLGLEIEYVMCRTAGDQATGPNCTWQMNFTIVNTIAAGTPPEFSTYYFRVSSNGGTTWTNLACSEKSGFPLPGQTATGSRTFTTGCNVENFVIELIPVSNNSGQCQNADLTLAISTGNVVLPIRFDNVNLRNLGNGSEVSWNIAVGNETVSHFEIQYSPNGQNFTTVGKQVGNQAARNTSYAFQDLAIRDKGFYRIKVVESNGTEYFSKVLFNNSSNNGSFRIFPNPAKTQIFIEKPAHQNRSSEISVFSVDGRQVLTGRLQGNAVDVSRLPDGQYILVVKDDEQTVYRQKFIIAK